MQYAPTVPATGEAFLDRVDELKRLQRVVDALVASQPRWLALVGPRKIGKTSLLKEWTQRTPRESVSWAVFDLFRDAPGPGFLRRWVVTTLGAALDVELGTSVASAVGDPGRWRTLLLASPTVRALPLDTQSWLLGVPDGAVTEGWVPLALELPEALARATGRRLIVVIDEFQELLESRALPGAGDVARRLRGTWQHHTHTTYVISGSAQHTIEQLVTQKRSAFFDHFDLLRLGPLPPDAAAELLVRVAGRPVALPAIAAAIDALGGHPFCLHALGDQLCGPPGEVGLPQIKSALQSLLFSSDGRLALHFEQTWREAVGRSASAAALMEQLADGPARLSDLAHRTGAATGATAATLHRLGEAVRKLPDGRYALADGVLALWLRWRAPGGTVVPMRVLGDEGERRAAEALATRGFELVYQSRGSRGSFDLLAIRNGGTLGVQVKRRALPVRLRKAELERMRADALGMGIPWVLVVVEPEAGVHFLDPEQAQGKTSFGAEQSIENLPRWFDLRWRA